MNKIFTEISSVVRDGLSIAQTYSHDLDHDFFMTWHKYSVKTLENLAEAEHMDNSVLLNYLKLSTRFIDPSVEPQRKLHACLVYLIDILDLYAKLLQKNYINN